MESEQTERQQQFIAAILVGLHHFQTLAAQGDEAIAALDAERQNLHRIVQYGLAFTETWPDAAIVIDQTFPLIERRGYWPEWIPVARQALSQCPEDSQRQKIVLLNRLGLLYRLNRQLSEAIATHQETETLAIELGDDALIAQTRSNLLSDYLNNRQYAEAEQIGLQVLSLFEKQQVEARWVSSTLRALGQTSRELGNLDVAESRSEAATAIWRTANEPTELARSLNDLANIYVATEKFDQAIRCYQEALDILQSSVNELDKALIYINLGALYFRQRRLMEAESAFREADSPYLRRSPQYYYQALVANGLGNVFLEQRQFPEATLYLEEAIKLWRMINDQVNLANTLGGLGEIRGMQGQITAALSLYNEAIMLLEQYPDSDWARRFLRRIEAQRQGLSADEEE